MNTLIKYGKNIINTAQISPVQPIYVSKFNEEAYKQFAADFNAAEQRGQGIIPIVIDSYGGSVNALIGMVSIIKNSKATVATICETKAMSCGAILFSCGTRGHRFVSPHASLMLHQVSSWNEGKIDEIKASVEYSDALNTQIFTILDKNCGQEVGFFKKKMAERQNTDWFMFPDEIVSLGIADQIKVPTFKVTIEPVYTLS